MRKIGFIFTLTFIFIVTIVKAQDSKEALVFRKGFDFEKYKLSTESLYPEINQDDIKAIRLSYKEISKADISNSLLFNPEVSEGSSINLFELLIAAIEDKGLKVYDPETEFLDFTDPTNIDQIKQLFAGNDDESAQIEINPQEVVSYLLLESTIYDVNNKVIETRPLVLCPIRSFNHIYSDDGSSEVRKTMLFWVYFSDIMDVVSNLAPQKKVNGIASALDFFSKNKYSGENISSNFLEYSFAIDDYDVDTVNNKNLRQAFSEGIFVDPNNLLFQGLLEKNVEKKSLIPDIQKINQQEIAFAKYAYKSISINDPANWPIFYPVNEVFGQKSLFQTLIQAISNSNIAVTDTYGEKVFEFDDVRETMDALDKEEIVFDPVTEEEKVFNIEGEIRYDEIKEYLLKEAVFCNSEGTVVATRIVGITPIRYFIRDYMYEEEYSRMPVFFVPFARSEVKQLLVNNFTQQFNVNSEMSFLSFFIEEKFASNKTRYEPTTVGNALKECGVPNEKKQDEVQMFPPEKFSFDELKVVVRKVKLSDSVFSYDEYNEQLFAYMDNNYLESPVSFTSQPKNAPLFFALEQNGFSPFINNALSCVENGTTKVYLNSSEKLFGENVSYNEIKDILEVEGISISFDPETGMEQEFVVEREVEQRDFDEYLVMELHSGSEIFPVAICPGVSQNMYVYFDNWGKENGKFPFWILLNRSFMEKLTGLKIHSFKDGSERSFYDFFNNLEYSGDVTSEKNISPEEGLEIAKMLEL